MEQRLTADFINKAVSQTVWDLANRVLYDLCRAHPRHNEDDAIIAKVLLIGRTYAAALERRRERGDTVGDAFYEDHIVPRTRESEIDDWFRSLASSPRDDIAKILETHIKVMDLFAKISGLEKRSLASKYLHFHFPEHFYIYDSRAQGAVSKLSTSVRMKSLTRVRCDDVYARFFQRCYGLKGEMESIVSRSLTPRDFDKVLLAYGRVAPSMAH